MIDYSKLLPRILEKMFPDPDIREEIVDVMDQYGHAEFQREGDRVRMAILKLAGKSPERVRYYTLMACRDYRDVLAAAEYPGEIGYYPWKENDPERLEQIRGEDLQQYQEWYLGILWDGKEAEKIS